MAVSMDENISLFLSPKYQLPLSTDGDHCPTVTRVANCKHLLRILKSFTRMNKFIYRALSGSLYGQQSGQDEQQTDSTVSPTPEQDSKNQIEEDLRPRYDISWFESIEHPLVLESYVKVKSKCGLTIPEQLFLDWMEKKRLETLSETTMADVFELVSKFNQIFARELQDWKHRTKEQLEVNICVLLYDSFPDIDVVSKDSISYVSSVSISPDTVFNYKPPPPSPVKERSGLFVTMSMVEQYETSADSTTMIPRSAEFHWKPPLDLLPTPKQLEEMTLSMAIVVNDPILEEQTSTDQDLTDAQGDGKNEDIELQVFSITYGEVDEVHSDEGDSNEGDEGAELPGPLTAAVQDGCSGYEEKCQSSGGAKKFRRKSSKKAVRSKNGRHSHDGSFSAKPKKISKRRSAPEVIGSGTNRRLSKPRRRESSCKLSLPTNDLNSHYPSISEKEELFEETSEIVEESEDGDTSFRSESLSFYSQQTESVYADEEAEVKIPRDEEPEVEIHKDEEADLEVEAHEASFITVEQLSVFRQSLEVQQELEKKVFEEINAREQLFKLNKNVKLVYPTMMNLDGEDEDTTDSVSSESNNEASITLIKELCHAYERFTESTRMLAEEVDMIRDLKHAAKEFRLWLVCGGYRVPRSSVYDLELSHAVFGEELYISLMNLGSALKRCAAGKQ